MIEERNLSLDKIKVFIVTSQVKDLKIASLKLQRDITTIVRNLNDLEKELNIKIYYRYGNKIELTAEGEELFLDYEKAYNLFFVAGKKRKQRKNLNSGKLSIGISSKLDLSILSNFILKFKKKYPKVIIKIINIDSDKLYDNLKQFKFDFIISEEAIALKSASSYKFAIDLCLAYKRKYYKDLKRISDLKDKELIINTTELEYISLVEEFKKASAPLNITIESSSYKTNLDYAEKGLGIALVPTEYINDTWEIMPLIIKKNLYLNYIDSVISPTTKIFIDDLKAYFKI